jgi:hypothetical protein
MTYGDDNIMTVKEGFSGVNHTRIASVFETMGIKYTMADKDAESVPYIHLSEASFLKHFAFWDDELKLYRCPCEDGSIAKMLHSHMKSDVLTMEQSSAEAISNAALKYFEFGREVYEEKRGQLMDVAREAGLMGYVADLPSYDERLDWYRGKFCLESQSGNINECDNSKEEELQQQCIQEMDFPCIGKEYRFPGGRVGDLLFLDQAENVYYVVETKSLKGVSHKRMKQRRTHARKQVREFSRAMEALYPKSEIVGAIYTEDGFEYVYSSFGEILNSAVGRE